LSPEKIELAKQQPRQVEFLEKDELKKIILNEEKNLKMVK